MGRPQRRFGREVEAEASRRAIALLTGLAPIARDSGTARAKRHVQGGRKRVRNALYMDSPAASRSGRWKQAYDHLIGCGKAPKQALIAINAAVRTSQTVNNSPIP